MKRLVSTLLLAILLLGLPAGAAVADPVKYSLSMFHFNIQYVIGGLYGFVPLPIDIPSWEIGPDEVEDMIVTESFVPVLDLLEHHTNWTLTIELQAYFIEVLAERFPEVLDQLRDLVDAGGVELVSFHYADQLFIAYPYEDWQVSNDRAKAVFEQYDLTLSPVVFCQEGQAGEGMTERMAETGYDILAWPKNLWSWQHGDFDAAPFYQMGDTYVVAGGKGVSDDVNQVYVDWSFLDDGEKMATGDFDPYFPWFFHYQEGSVAEYEAGLMEKEADGYKIGSISDYVNDLLDAGIDPEPAPRLLDGTWQPDSTEGVSMWLGRGGLWRKDERDNHVRSLAYQAHQEILAAETIAEQAGLDRAAVLDEAWRQLHNADVSDGSGINPYRGEVEYVIASAAEAIRIARDVIEEAKTALSLENVLIDTANGEVTAGEYEKPGEKVPQGPFQILVQAKDRTFKTKWFQVSEDPATWRLEIAFSDSENKKARELFVTFPGTGDEILTTTALIDDEVRSYPWADFNFEFWYLPAPTGLIGLGDGTWLVKDAANEHVGAYIEPSTRNVRFEDQTAPWFETITWVFYVVQGSAADALTLADRVNVHPVLAR
ncbi:MAG: hypothetical protein GX444_11885 [Myxococcales bacterium]|nr:hypothetical protein [Myxococcales bacterium]